MLYCRRTVFWFLEERGDERFLRRLHQLYDTLVDRVFVLVQPTVRVVSDLRHTVVLPYTQGDSDVSSSFLSVPAVLAAKM